MTSEPSGVLKAALKSKCRFPWARSVSLWPAATTTDQCVVTRSERRGSIPATVGTEESLRVEVLTEASLAGRGGSASREPMRDASGRAYS